VAWPVRRFVGLGNVDIGVRERNREKARFQASMRCDNTQKVAKGGTITAFEKFIKPTDQPGHIRRKAAADKPFKFANTPTASLNAKVAAVGACPKDSREMSSRSCGESREPIGDSSRKRSSLQRRRDPQTGN
jgi:hypothetical protein